MGNKIINTSDGSYSIYVPELDETYHSRHGALQEAVHVFIQNGLATFDQDNVRIFEVGLGTGLNCLLTLSYASKHGKTIKYTGIERYPIGSELIKELSSVKNSYTDICGQDLFNQLHSCPWESPFKLADEFELTKLKSNWKTYVPAEKFDLIYYDAFGHRAQENMWDKKLLKKCYDMLSEGGKFVTYAAKGQLRRDLQECGFEVERLPGPPGKREMLRGTKS